MRLDHNFFFVQKLTDPKVRKGQRSVKDIQEKKNEQNLDEAVEVKCAFLTLIMHAFLGRFILTCLSVYVCCTYMPCGYLDLLVLER